MKHLLIQPRRVLAGTSPALVAGGEMSTLAQYRNELAEMQGRLSRVRVDLRAVSGHPVSPVLRGEVRRASGIDPETRLDKAYFRINQAFSGLRQRLHKLAVQGEFGIRGVPGVRGRVKAIAKRLQFWERQLFHFERAVRTWEHGVQLAMKGSRP